MRCMMEYEKKINGVLVAKIISDSIDYTKKGYELVGMKQLEKFSELKGITNRIDFLEDCIAEMAGVIYNTEEIT